MKWLHDWYATCASVGFRFHQMILETCLNSRCPSSFWHVVRIWSLKSYILSRLNFFCNKTPYSSKGLKNRQTSQFKLCSQSLSVPQIFSKYKYFSYPAWHLFLSASYNLLHLTKLIIRMILPLCCIFCTIFGISYYFCCFINIHECFLNWLSLSFLN